MKAPLVIFPAIFWLVGCSEAPRKPEENGVPVSIRTVTVTAEPWPEEYEAVGSVRARTAAVLSAKVMGYVRQTPSKSDGRELRTSITESGRRLLEDISLQHTSLYETAIRSMT
jgi:hypothetical protein